MLDLDKRPDIPAMALREDLQEGFVPGCEAFRRMPDWAA
jgi:hypothetical protein